MSDEAKPVFNIGGYLKDQGVEVSNVDDKGNVYIKDPSGDEKRFNAEGFMKDAGIPKGTTLKWNDPSTALPVSPVSTADRAKLALGNAKGNVAYLRTKFDHVAQNEDGDLVVQKNGVWHKTDPGLFESISRGNPWELAKEIGKDVVEFAAGSGAQLAGSVAGAAAGAVGGVPGMIAGSAAGAGAGEALRTSLGRVVGTYEASPQEQMKDVAWESLLGLGGEAVGLGVKPGLGMLKAAANKIGRFSADATKDILSSVYGVGTGLGKPGAQRLLSRASEVIGEAESAIARGGKTEAAIDLLKKDNDHLAEAFLNDADKALPKRYGEMKGALLKEVPEHFKFDTNEAAENVYKSLQENGFGVMEKDAGKPAKFKIPDDKDFAKYAQDVPNLRPTTPEFRQKLQSFVQGVENKRGTGLVAGPRGAEVGLELNKVMNEFQRSLLAGNQDRVLEAALTGAKKAFTNTLDQSFIKASTGNTAGLAGSYAEMQKLYGKYSKITDSLRTLKNGADGAEKLADIITKNSHAKRGFIGDLADMAELLGPDKAGILDKIADKHTAIGTIGAFPSLRPTGFGAAQMGALGAAAATLNPAAAAGVAVSSPALVRAQVKYGYKLVDFVKSLDPMKRMTLLQNPEATADLLRSTLQAAGHEQSVRDDLLKESGAAQK